MGDTDLDDEHSIELLRRSIAMLTPGSEALGREDALLVLAKLRDRTREARASSAG